MEIKQGEEHAEIIKEKGDNTDNYILQKNKKTIVAISIITVFLIVLILGIVLSGILFESTP